MSVVVACGSFTSMNGRRRGNDYFVSVLLLLLSLPLALRDHGLTNSSPRLPPLPPSLPPSLSPFLLLGGAREGDGGSPLQGGPFPGLFGRGGGA